MRKRILFIVTFILISFLPGFDFKCDDEEKDPIKILVTCSGPFSGYYIYNSSTPVGFGGGTTGDNPYIISGSTYYYERSFNDLDSIEVDATRDDRCLYFKD